MATMMERFPKAVRGVFRRSPGKGAAISSKPLPLSDKESLESGPSATEVAGAPISLPDDQAKEVVRLVNQRFTDSERQRQMLEGEWAVCMAYYNNRQWVEWDPERGIRDIRDKNDLRWYRTENLIAPLCAVATSRITSNRPDVQLVPRSDRELDEEATKEARLVVEHYNKKYRFRETLQGMATYAWMVTTSFLHQSWNPEALAEVPIEFDKERTPTKYANRHVGDYHEEIVPGHEVYADPRARRWRECEWVIHAQLMTNEDIERRFGRPVQGGSPGRTLFGGLVSQFVSPWASNTGENRREQLVKTCYEEPSVRYPEGRMLVVIGSECVECREALPCGFIPLLPLGCRQALESPYHASIGALLTQPQYDYNLLRSRILGGLRDQKLTIVREKGDGAGADLNEDIQSDSGGLDETPRLRTIYYKRGHNPPQFTLPQMMPYSELSQVAEGIKQGMNGLAGVHRVSTGAGDPNATSGISIRLLKDSDESSGSEFSHEVEVFLEERAARMLKLVAEYVEEPRAWDLDERNNTQDHELVYSGLEALKKGGMAAVKVIEGSATPRTPEAEDNQVMQMFQAGLLGNPQDPATADMVLQLLHTPIASRIEEMKEEAKALKLKEAAIQEQLEAQVPDAAMGGQEPAMPGMQQGAPSMPPGMPPPPPIESVAGVPPGGQMPQDNEMPMMAE